MKKLVLVAAILVLLSMTILAQATIAVSKIGDNGWYSDDTRTSAGTDLVGTNYTHANKPGQTATTADDALIANEIQFVNDAPDSVKALKLSFGAGTGGKATISRINTSDNGFATGSWYNDFILNMRRYRIGTDSTTGTNTTIKIGVQTTLWANSQAGFTATRSGESAWDISMVYQGNYTPFNTWEDVSLNSTTGTWKIYAQSGNNYFKTLDGSFTTTNLSLADWAANSIWGSRLFGDGAKVTSVMIGAGSFASASTGYIDYIQTNLLDNGERNDFTTPEPSSILALAGGLVSLIAIKRRKA